MTFDLSDGIGFDDIGYDVEDQRKNFRSFRRSWIPAIKVILASASDIFGDWVFFLRTRNTSGLDEFERPLWFFCVVSSVLGGLTLVSIIMERFPVFVNNHNKYKENCLNVARTLLGLEMFVEDIPQLILTVMVMNAKAGGVWTPVSVFNATTSAFNFTFNLLDLFMPLDEEHFQKEYDSGKKDDDFRKEFDTGKKGVDNNGHQGNPANAKIGMVEMGQRPYLEESGSGGINQNDFKENLLYYSDQEIHRPASSSSLGSNDVRAQRMTWT